MPARIKLSFAKLGWLDRIFLAVLALALAARYALAGSGLALLLAIVAFVLAVAVSFKWLVAFLRKAIWRLRYRLVVAYLFIAVVPIVLIVFLVSLGAYVLTGQVAAYLVTNELERRTADLLMPARGLAWTAPESRSTHARWLAPAFWNRFPGFEVIIRDDTTWRYPENSKLTPPPAGWGDVSGIVRKNGALYLWAHSIHDATEVTIVVPVTQLMLAQLAPGLGELSFRKRQAGAPPERLPDSPEHIETRVPPAVNFLDWEVPYPTMVPVAVWEAPGTYEQDALFLITRSSAVLRTIFGQKIEWREGETVGSLTTLAFFVLVVVLVAVELVSIIIGVRLTRTITHAVHNLYEGTQRIRVGDFSHRIEVQGNDQLADLSRSFNHMTEDLEKLVEVAKEKERLQSEIEIAREVQNQLFPKTVPESESLRLAATCRPARLVSGDSYDYMNVDSRIALAIGDVAGKGISAALLMATIQSTMRTQLRAGHELAAAVGGGGQTVGLSSATLVSRLNQHLYAFTPPEKFATFFFALYDEATGRMTYTNAGHLPPILVRDGKASRLDVTGTVVGAFSFSQYGESTVQLEPGDLLVGFTDGITEPENEFGEMFGEDRLTELVLKHASQGSDEIIAAVMDSVRHWTGSPELQDDMTLLLARRV